MLKATDNEKADRRNHVKARIERIERAKRSSLVNSRQERLGLVILLFMVSDKYFGVCLLGFRS
jgi:hypothetical protein